MGPQDYESEVEDAGRRDADQPRPVLAYATPPPPPPKPQPRVELADAAVLGKYMLAGIVLAVLGVLIVVAAIIVRDVLR